jgi:hypothetical protein
VFYSYFWLRKDGTPYYVGKGKGNRAFLTNKHSVECPGDTSRIVIQNYESEAEAFEAEKFFIAFYGRVDLGTGCLRNYTDGGEGLAGLLRTNSHSQKISQAKKGIKPKWANPNGYVRTEDHKRQLRERMLGNKQTAGTTFNRGREQSLALRKRRAGLTAGRVRINGRFT